MKNITFLSIDNQNDFTDIPENILANMKEYTTNDKSTNYNPSLAVNGAWQDALNTADFISKYRNNITDIILTLDTHEQYHIAHSLFWINEEGNQPDPFTLITAQDVIEGKWKAVNPKDQGVALDYVEKLERHTELKLCIWPTHCVLGSLGHKLVAPVEEAIKQWERLHHTASYKVLKGHYAYTEHYGAIEAEVPYYGVQETLMNEKLLRRIQKSDQLIVSGQALSHCVAATVRQIVKYLGDGFAKKIILLKDTSHPVTGFEQLADNFINELTKKGMLYLNSNEIDTYIKKPVKIVRSNKKIRNN